MTREISAELAEALSRKHRVPIILAEFEFASGTVGMWTGFGTLTWGDKTFVGGGNLVNTSEVRETQDLQATNVIFNLNGVVPENMALALNPSEYKRRPCRLYVGVVEASARLLAEDGGGLLLEDGGDILLEITSTLAIEPYQVFAGLMDVVQGVIDVPFSSLKLSAENAAALLRRANLSRYTDEDQQAKFPGDTFFKRTPQLMDTSITW